MPNTDQIQIEYTRAARSIQLTRGDAKIVLSDVSAGVLTDWTPEHQRLLDDVVVILLRGESAFREREAWLEKITRPERDLWNDE